MPVFYLGQETVIMLVNSFNVNLLLTGFHGCLCMYYEALVSGTYLISGSSLIQGVN